MKRFNNYINLGLLFDGIFLLGNCTNLLPEFTKSLCIGLGFTLMFIGIYSETHDISRIRNYKKGYLTGYYQDRSICSYFCLNALCIEKRRRVLDYIIIFKVF